jgi:peptidyl-prolyl cis-trans isomerase A (cyclophilin A)
MRWLDLVKRALVSNQQSLRVAPRAAGPVFEQLEPRLLMAGDLFSVTSIIADNRGQVVFTFSHDVNAGTITADSVRISTAGADAIIGTADDVIENRAASYDAANRRLTITATVPADQRYRVFVSSAILRDANGRALDGEFTGASTISGDGVEGGDLVFFSRRAATLIARFSTNRGTIDVNLFGDRAPQTVRNFLNYANRGVWDTTMFHRAAESGGVEFVIQGGGFFNQSPNFPGIPTDPSPQNEPGISNLRGTIAMAKLGNNPNSATNQWFFNLSDNSQNLNNQNGGFTVFGEITNAQGLSVIDAIAALATFDASSQNGAFNEVPVIDIAAVEARGTLIASDTVSFSRLAILVDLTAEPSSQLPAQGSVTIAQPPGQNRAFVTLFDLDGSGAVGNGSWFKVTFGPRDTITSIQITGSPAGRVGIVISDAASVGAITDLRRTPTGDIAFIVCESAIRSIRIASPLSGFNLNGFSVPGIILPEDTDGDGDVSDAVAIFTGTGLAMTTLQLLGGVNGDVVIPSGVATVVVGGLASNADFEVGSRGVTNAGTSYTFGRVVDSDIRSADRITVLRATEWRDDAGRQSLIRAPRIGPIVISGNRREGIAGSFDSDITLTATGLTEPIAPSIVIAGDIFGAVWNMPGQVGPVTIRGTATNWTISGATSILGITVGNVAQGNITTTGELRRITAGGWDKGAISARTAGTLRFNGDFNANFTLTGGGTAPVIRGFTATGASTNSTFTISGAVPQLEIVGAVDNLSFNLTNGDAGTLRFGPMTNSRINAGNRNVQTLTTPSFDGGELRANVYFNINIAGDFNGDIRPSFVDRLNVGGNFSGFLSVRIANFVTVNGDVRNSSWLFSEAFNANGRNVLEMNIGGAVIGSEIRSTGSVNAINIKALIDSGLYVGAPSVTGLPDSQGTINRNVRVEILNIRGSGAHPNGLTNSFVVLGQLGLGRIENPLTDNLGRTFGVSIGDIQRLQLKADGRELDLRTLSTSPQPFGDFQLRLDFIPPVPQGA